MKPGYTTETDLNSLEEGCNVECVVTDNYHYMNHTLHFYFDSIEDSTAFIDKYTIGFWIKKGTKRPDNWPNKN